MPKFLMLARSTDQAWNGISAEEAQRIVQQYVDWSSRMRTAGRLAASNKLKDGEGRVLSGNGPQMAVKDGPYSETKEVVGGYWLLEAADFDEAVKLAQDSPHLRFGSLEIRAIEEM
ncbi:MAG TPA: YciI family protein [Thermoanaerobaculia bacterium]|nr:YciI family protein [Thermoanaerobaculia bacterium]